MEQRFVSLYLLLAALLMATLPCHADTPGSLSVSINNNAEFVELTGPWAFYWNRFLPPGQEPAEQPTAMVRLPGSWTRINSTEQPLPVTGFASYRLQVDLGDTPHHP